MIGTLTDKTVEIWEKEAEAGRLWLWSDINTKNAWPVMRKLQELETKHTIQRIELHISSGGGSLYHSLAISDVIKIMKTKVVGYAEGVCCSGALLILVGCPERITLPHTEFMFHGASFRQEEWERSKRMENYTDVCSKVDEKLCEYMEANTKKKASFWKKWIDKNDDFYFWADDALKYGVVDAVEYPNE